VGQCFRKNGKSNLFATKRKKTQIANPNMEMHQNDMSVEYLCYEDHTTIIVPWPCGTGTIAQIQYTTSHDSWTEQKHSLKMKNDCNYN